jgi:hypothetical protein
MTTENPSKSPLDAEYTAAGGKAIALLAKARSYFRSQGFRVRAEVLWPEGNPTFALRWDPHAPADSLGFMFKALTDFDVVSNRRKEWIAVSGAIANPAHPSIEELGPIFATLRMLPELKVEAELARDRALRALRSGAEEMEAWLGRVAPPPAVEP